MARGKVKLQYILDKSKREITLKKRKESLVKKVFELATLCAIEVLLVIYSPGVREPTTYPTAPEEVKRLYMKFLNKAEEERNKKVMTFETYVNGEVIKIEKQVLKLKRKRTEKELKIIWNDMANGNSSLLDHLGMDRVQELLRFLDEKQRSAVVRAQLLDMQSHDLRVLVDESDTPRDGTVEAVSYLSFIDWMRRVSNDYESNSSLNHAYVPSVTYPSADDPMSFGAAPSDIGNVSIGPGIDLSGYVHGHGAGGSNATNANIAFPPYPHNQNFNGSAGNLQSNMALPPPYVGVAGDSAGVGHQQGYTGNGIKEHVGFETKLPYGYILSNSATDQDDHSTCK